MWGLQMWEKGISVLTSLTVLPLSVTFHLLSKDVMLYTDNKNLLLLLKLDTLQTKLQTQILNLKLYNGFVLVKICCWQQIPDDSLATLLLRSLCIITIISLLENKVNVQTMTCWDSWSNNVLSPFTIWADFDWSIVSL